MHQEMTSSNFEAEYKGIVTSRFKTLMLLNPDVTYLDIQRKTGVGRKNIQRVFQENRMLKYEEVDPICSYFKIPKGALAGTEFPRLINLIRVEFENSNYSQALKYCYDLESSSLTLVEKAKSSLKIGDTLLKLEEFDRGYFHINNGYCIAMETNDEESVVEALHLLLKYHMNTKNYDILKNLANDFLQQNPYPHNLSHIGQLKHFLGVAHFYLGDKIDARKYYFEAVRHYQEINHRSLPRLRVTIADMDYHDKKYISSLEQFKSALNEQIENGDDIENILMTKKELARCLLMLNKKEEAVSVANDCIRIIDEKKLHFDNIKGKVLLVKIESTKDFSLCRDILSLKNISKEVMVNAADYVVSTSIEGGDLEKDFVMECYRIVRSYTGHFTNFKWGVWY